MGPFKKIQLNLIYKRHNLRYKNMGKLKVKVQKRVYKANTNKNKTTKLS